MDTLEGKNSKRIMNPTMKMVVKLCTVVVVVVILLVDTSHGETERRMNRQTSEEKKANADLLNQLKFQVSGMVNCGVKYRPLPRN